MADFEDLVVCTVVRMCMYECKKKIKTKQNNKKSKKKNKIKILLAIAFLVLPEKLTGTGINFAY